ncbi:ABC-2 type transport system permease protein [Mumia flava]|uniref:ABC-2 type transport system permease protein n=1 Tax=Mumia flava TaxID=1348852 RepID=A0A0B2AZQ0_9ACTN|nr:ABC transporter permease [Mumia flava]PJJ58560.1 ABC-2 type transport system permease protein [Mumia flava]
MRAFRSLSLAMTRGFLRDRMALFWSLAFPLMFLLLLGSLFADAGTPKSEVVQVGAVSVIDDAPAQTRAALDDALDITRTDDRDAAIADVRAGDADAAIEMDGDQVVLWYSAADQVGSAVVQGTVSAIVQSANLAASGQPPTYTLDPQQVEDESLEPIQFFTPSLLGWAIAMGAAFGAAANLVVWRRDGLLRRLRLSPVGTPSVVGARVTTALLLAGMQTVVFLVPAVAFMGLQLTDSWWLSLPLIAAATLAFLSLGLFIGSFSKTEEGATGLANFVILPMAFLSGSFFPLDGAPAWLQALSRVLPLRWLNEGMSDVMVRGQGVEAIIAPMLGLLAFAAVMTALATRFFRWDPA